MIDDLVLPDDATRPEPIVFDNLTDAEMAPARHLAMVHDHQRDNMRALREMIEAARTGRISAHQLDAAASALPLFENYRRFGTLCGQHCQIVHTHHSIEDAHLFPALSSRAEAFRRIIARLTEEHDIVHALLLSLVSELKALLEAPSESAFEAAVTTYDTIEKLLLSHFSYEERAIGPALGRFGIGV